MDKTFLLLGAVAAFLAGRITRGGEVPNGAVMAAALLGIACTYYGFGALVDWFNWPTAFLITGAVTAVLGHQVDMTFETTTILLPHIREGKLKGLAVTSAARNPQAPDIPTMVEAGVPDYVAPSFNGVVAPAGTPAAVTEKLNGAINNILKTSEVAAEIEKLGGQINVGSPADFAAFIAVEAKRWLDVADANNIKVD